MASCKSYQNRKHEIELLNKQLAEAEYQLRKIQQEVALLRYTNQKLMNSIYDYVNLQINPVPVIVQNTGKQEIESLKKEIEALNITLNLYRRYILKAYPVTMPERLERVEIPSCLKPLDAIRYMGERES